MFPINEQFAAASRQFAQTAAQVNRLALSHAEHLLGIAQGEAADLAGGVRELARGRGELVVELVELFDVDLVHGGSPAVIRQGMPVLCVAA